MERRKEKLSVIISCYNKETSYEKSSINYNISSRGENENDKEME